MRISINTNSLINSQKLGEILRAPIIIRVNKFDEQAADNFSKQIEAAHNTGQPVIPIVIDSYGGQVYSLLAMIDSIRYASLPVATIVEGKAMSCGAILLTYGQEGMRFAGPNSTILIHDVSNMSLGKVEEIKAGAKEVERLNRLVYVEMAKNCGKDEEYFIREVHNRGHADWWLMPEEARGHNIVNHVRIPILELEVSAKYSFR